MANSLLPKKLARNASVAMKVSPCLNVLGTVSLDKPGPEGDRGSRLKLDSTDSRMNVVDCLGSPSIACRS